jgi:3-methyladenine DNA glycosylase/8-oxoguanine DNA glycosylase
VSELRRTWTPEHPVDLAAILGPLARGRGDRTMRIAASGREVWWATSTPDGPGTLHLSSSTGAGELRAAAWGAGATWLIESAPSVVGADDNVDGFEPAHPVVAEAWRRHQGWRMPRTRRPFDSCVAAVIEQKVTGVEARRSLRWLVATLGEPAPGPVPTGLTVPPTPAALRTISDSDLHRAGITPQRCRTLRTVAMASTALQRTADLDGASADAVIRALPGLGAWTSAEVRQRAHGDADAVSVGDFHVAKDVCWWLTGERGGSDERMVELLQPYAGHRYRVQRLMELTGAGAPRRGPRMTVPEHRRW